MIEHIITIFLPLIIIAPFAIFALQIQRVRKGIQKWLKATLLFAAFSILPVLIYALLIVGFIAVEELTKFSIVTEGIARSFIFIVVLGLGEVILLFLVFSIAAFFMRSKDV